MLTRSIQQNLTTSQSNSQGIGLYTAAILLMAVMYALTKHLAQSYPIGQIVFFRGLIGVLPVLVLVWFSGGLDSIKTKRPAVHALRGLINLCVMGGFAYAFSTLPLANAYAISFVAPLFLAAFAAPMLGEVVRRRQWVAILVGFIGVLIILQPRPAGLDNTWSLGAMAALAGAVCYALHLTMARALAQVETQAAIGFYPAVIAALASFAFLPAGFVMPTGLDLVLLCGIGLLGGGSTLLLNAAFKVAPSGVLAPIDYSGMVWAVFFGFVLWGELPDMVTMNGAALIMLSGFYVLRLETRKTQRLRLG